ncbi:MAG TPA: SpoIID/LytB domain-containing protein, partial [Pyrinomonadaceae bacterium]|nr:SpoIID/LytB domain-containing protein [Pyrinomonadaceae bacterium]
MLIRVLTSVFICASLIFVVLIHKDRRPLPDLQSVAANALGDREGAIIVVDPQTGQVQAAVNPDLAQQSFPPGSTIKPFTALTALRAGVIEENTRLRCRYDQKHNETVEVCSHPLNLPPLNVEEALAYSCNHYFAKTGERINADALAHTLTQFGFVSINRSRWEPHSAIGEGEFVQITPMQLALAYTALFNGGRLFNPGSEPTQVRITEAERAMLLAGMRGAVKFGTADQTELDTAINYVIGKTGTSTHLQGFRSQGWFVGLAFAPNKPPEPQHAQRAVVVYLKKGHGSDAAAVAAPILKLPLEDYVARVVAAEGSIDNQTESLKALAVAVRTYALKNLGRHKREGYDFCSTTHCQRFEFTAPIAAAARAAYETAGLILNDQRGLIADSYFSASCGGMTSNLQALWGAPPPPHLRGVRDEYCNAGSHAHWTDTIPQQRMLKALRSDPRTNVGEKIRELTVAKRDQTGRAELVSIVGSQKRVINGWDFKLIVGRALGWNVLKSSRFSVSRSGSDFVFRGSGFGHGLGLCQEGAQEMAQRGYSYNQILAKYFPGTRVGPQMKQTNRARSAHFSISSVEKLEAQEVQQLLVLLESNRSTLARRLSTAGVEFQFPEVEIFINKTTGDFVGRTGMPPWAAAATRHHRIELQPLALLKQRGILETTLRHELVHVVIEAVGGNQTPRWLAEGIALHLAGEGKLLAQPGNTPAMAPKELEQKLANPKTAAEMKQAYAAAYRTVRELIRVEG